VTAIPDISDTAAAATESSGEVLGALLLIPAFFAGAGIPAFSFASALSYPLSLAGPIVGAWYLIGIGVTVYLLARRRSSLQRLSESVDDEPTPAPGPKHAAALAVEGG
jgi:hypothetical protein